MYCVFILIAVVRWFLCQMCCCVVYAGHNAVGVEVLIHAELVLDREVLRLSSGF